LRAPCSVTKANQSLNPPSGLAHSYPRGGLQWKLPIKDLISKGLVIDIFQAEEALTLNRFIGKNAGILNNNNFGNLFGSMQFILSRHFILAVARLYAAPNPRYPIRIIPCVLEFYRKMQTEWATRLNPFRSEKGEIPMAMKVEIKDNKLYIEIDLETPTPSASGKTLVVASTRGNVVTTAKVNDKPVIIGLNAYIKP
jgi:hypothetical protein